MVHAQFLNYELLYPVGYLSQIIGDNGVIITREVTAWVIVLVIDSRGKFRATLSQGCQNAANALVYDRHTHGVIRWLFVCMRFA